VRFIWDPENILHIARHGVTPQEAEDVLLDDETIHVPSHSGRLSAYGLGGMMFGSWGNPDPDECTRMIDLALESGINFIDTADTYGSGGSEEIIGRALLGRRDEVRVDANRRDMRNGRIPRHRPDRLLAELSDSSFRVLSFERRQIEHGNGQADPRLLRGFLDRPFAQRCRALLDPDLIHAWNAREIEGESRGAHGD